MPEKRQLFSEQEVGALVRRAVELQEASQTDYQPGVTLDELSRIASEIGVDPKYLTQAIAETGKIDVKRSAFNLTEEFERVVESELSPEDFDIILKCAKSVNTRRGGGLLQVGRTLSGRVWTGSSFANLDVSSRNGRTKVDVKSNPLFAYLVTFHPAIFASAVTAGVMSHSQPLLGAGIAVGLLGAATIAFRFLVRKGHKAAKELTEKIVKTIEDNAEEKAAALQATGSPSIPVEPDVRENLSASS